MVQENVAKIIVGLYGVAVVAVVWACKEHTKAYKKHLKEENKIFEKYLKERIKSNKE